MCRGAILLLLTCFLISSPASARDSGEAYKLLPVIKPTPRILTSDALLSPAPAIPGRAVAQSSKGVDTPLEIQAETPGIHWYGFYNPASGAAVEGETWTFDHGAADPFEGWSLTESLGGTVPMRWITPAIWAGHGNGPAAPILYGNASWWVGYFEDEACEFGYVAGLGYGDFWCLELISPPFLDASGTGVSLDFWYFVDLEEHFDSVRVVVAQGASRTELGSLTGKQGGPLTPQFQSYAFVPSTTEPFRFVFEFHSDNNYSDEDGIYATVSGAFGLDNVDVVGSGVTPLADPPPYDFESGPQGFSVNVCPRATYEGLNDVSAYGIDGNDCDVTGTVLEFHDGAMQHPYGQDDAIISPSIALPATGGPFNIFAEYSIYAEPSPYVTGWNWDWSYYPYTCPNTGATEWSPFAGFRNTYVALGDDCVRYRTFATDTAAGGWPYGAGKNLIPDNADSVRFVLRVANYWATPVSDMPWPLFDTIHIGVSQRATVLHVPSPTYKTIQKGIDMADPGDTVLVRSGVYTGAGNVDLSFGGKNIVLLSEAGAAETIIDCEGSARAMAFNSGEDHTSVVRGFTFRNGDGSGVGGGALHFYHASPTFAACVVESSTTSVPGGGMYISGGPRFFGCTFQYNTCPDAGGAIAIADGSPQFRDCTVRGNTSGPLGGGVVIDGGGPRFVSTRFEDNGALDGGGVAVLGGEMSFVACHFQNNGASNKGGAVLILDGSPRFDNCIIELSSAFRGAGVHTESWAAPAFFECSIESNRASGPGAGVCVGDGNPTFTGCRLSDNSSFDAGGGAALHGGASIFTGCDVTRNIGGGLTIGEGPHLVSNCTIAGNLGSNGGGVYIQPVSESRLRGCLISGNTAGADGGGVWIGIGLGIRPEIERCTIADNHALGDGGGMYVENVHGGADTLDVERTIVSSNCSALGEDLMFDTVNPSSAVRFNCSAMDPIHVMSNGTVLYEGGHVTSDPAFCAPEGCFSAPTVAGDYAIWSYSPCVARNNACGMHIGARGVGCGTTGADGPERPAVTRLRQNVPNPLRKTTTIHFDLEAPGPVSLRIYDVSGRLLRTLVDGYLPAARHTVVWDGWDDLGRPVAAGICFYRLSAGGRSLTRKMLLMK